MSQDPIVIVGMARTPMGGFMGDLSAMKTTDLGAAAIKAAVEKAGVSNEDVQEVIMGCVLPAALGQAPARQAALAADLPLSTGCTTINKVCGSGMKTVMLAHDLITAGTNDVMVAGGMESMSNAPHMLPNARSGYRFGHVKALDHMAFDGLEDAYEGIAMGNYAEDCAERYQFTREQQDEYAITSLARAKAAIENGSFDEEVVPVTIKTRKGEVTIEHDEQPLKGRPEKIPSLRPAFKKDGTVTAANASSISDGAAAMVLMRQSEAEKRGLTPLAKIVGHATHARKPAEFTIAPVTAIQSLLDKINWSVDDVDLFEINEAFAVVTMAAIKDLGLDHEKVNVHGGACALGHPIGTSGTRILVTLIAALKKYGKSKGVAGICIGGGEATAMAIELV
ncbi:acetyl-CoA C-acyltransferase [Aliikangiella marina]|uniref:Acetyl-CoA C-acyltransferase n=1 Tax=Aliikangiella marina TaxID=1712262 RepID=A0A545TJX4_9GAMM|nr:acetyl-CoA C-acyltransferase [Aliikangiella marina]TQV77507.1 acetyl-CoA C-acyltransferase [Aliikangiella marina]